MLDEAGHVKLIDFGLSKLNMNEGALTNTFCGTGMCILYYLQWRRQHGFDGFGRTHQFFERGSRTHQIFGKKVRKLVYFWSMKDL